MLKTKLCALAAACLGLFSVAACAADGADAGLVQRGQYLATAGDCVACHSAPGGKPFAGGLEIATPLGKIVSTNITPSTSHGIGRYTPAQFGEALRHGVRADGARLYPAMPYTAYAKLTDADVAALFAYFRQGVQPVDAAPPATDLPFPFDIRQSMAVWNLLFLDGKPFTPDAGKSAEWNRGAYLVEGLAHCSTCHTPRNPLMAEDSSRSLGGAQLGAWYAPNISSDPVSGIGGWSQGEIVGYLRTGRVEGKAQAGGPMAEAIDHSLRHLTDADLGAIATYLKAGPAVHDSADTQPAYAWGKPTAAFEGARGAALPADGDQWTGAQLYDANCASCHQPQAGGTPSFDGARLPSLWHNTALGHANPSNLVAAILQGVQRQPGGANVLMPAFADKLSDTQIATLGNYLLKNFGNPATQLSAEQVRSLRADGAGGSSLVLLARVGMGVGVLVVLLAIGWLLRRKRTR